MRIVWLVLGCLCLGLGTVGIVLPILPTVPFYMATLFCFAKIEQPREEKEGERERKREKEDVENKNEFRIRILK